LRGFESGAQMCGTADPVRVPMTVWRILETSPHSGRGLIKLPTIHPCSRRHIDGIDMHCAVASRSQELVMKVLSAQASENSVPSPVPVRG
jgi:hypothetical protein